MRYPDARKMMALRIVRMHQAQRRRTAFVAGQPMRRGLARLRRLPWFRARVAAARLARRRAFMSNVRHNGSVYRGSRVFGSAAYRFGRR